MHTEEATRENREERPNYRRAAFEVLDHLTDAGYALRAAHAALGPTSPDEGQTSTYIRGLLTALKAALDGVGDNIATLVELKDQETKRDA